MHRYVILAIRSFNYIESKTGNMLIRYHPESVVAIIDPDKEGKTAQDVLGWGGEIPCLSSFKETKIFQPTHLVVGNAPQGGFLDKTTLKEIHDAIDHGLHIISGMHMFLNDDLELSKKAAKNNVNLIDLRKPNFPPKFPKGSWKKRRFPVLTIVGSDCDTGKMTTAWEISESLKKRKRKIEFIATGQTGILLSGKGVPIDAVISDFMAGEIEFCLDQLPADTELAIVEGQGALNNVLYSGVTLGLLHGSMPDYLIFTHEPGRQIDVASNVIPDLKYLMDMYINLLKPFKNTKFIGVNLLTIKLTESETKNIINQFYEEFNIPVTDLIRYGSEIFINEIEKNIFE
tara:strand:- start:652 stop:1683 length:1032 start_codon:yes stop_codon:yes gene_type:complete